MQVNYYAEVIYTINGVEKKQNFYGVVPGETKRRDINNIIKMNHPYDDVRILSNTLRVAL